MAYIMYIYAYFHILINFFIYKFIYKYTYKLFIAIDFGKKQIFLRSNKRILLIVL